MYTCDYCSSSHSSKSKLTSHILNCDDRPSGAYFKCEYCENRYVSKQGLIDHLESCRKKQQVQSRNREDSPDHECRHCGEVFEFEHKLTHHKHSCNKRNFSNEAPERNLKGYVCHYEPNGGYGFISTNDLDQNHKSDSENAGDVFFHVSSYPNNQPQENDRLRFDIVDGDEGFKAVNITIDYKRPPTKPDNTFASKRKRWGKTDE